RVEVREESRIAIGEVLAVWSHGDPGDGDHAIRRWRCDVDPVGMLSGSEVEAIDGCRDSSAQEVEQGFVSLAEAAHAGVRWNAGQGTAFATRYTVERKRSTGTKRRHPLAIMGGTGLLVSADLLVGDSAPLTAREVELVEPNSMPLLACDQAEPRSVRE